MKQALTTGEQSVAGIIVAIIWLGFACAIVAPFALLCLLVAGAPQ